jgi:hypothetical protein
MRGGIIKTMRRAAIERGQDRGISDHVLDSGTASSPIIGASSPPSCMTS